MDTPDPTTQMALIATGRSRARISDIRRMALLVPETWLAKSAVIAAEDGRHKESAMMLAVLTNRDIELLSKVFHRAVLKPQTLRQYVAYLRSGRRRSLGTRPKRLIRDWLNAQPPWLLRAEAFGSFRPTLADIVRATHPKPVDEAHSVVFAWMVGKPTPVSSFPEGPRSLDEGGDDQSPRTPVERRVRAGPRLRGRSISMVEGVEL